MVTTRSGVKKAAAVVGTSALLAGAAIGMASNTAHAASSPTRNGVCQSGEFCYFYNSGEKGSVSDFTSSVSTYGTDKATCYVFKGAGSGKGKCIKNNAASVWNRTSKSVTVYYNSGYSGSSQTIKAGAKANLSSKLKNNDASHHIGAISGGAIGDDYKGHWGSTYGFAYRNCTAFAAYRIVHRLGVSGFKNTYKGQVWGDAGHWDNAARAVGIKVNNTPTVGGIAINDVHRSSVDGKYHGHVAYISKVYSNGSFDVEEYNWAHPLNYGTRHIAGVNNADQGFQHVIHFNGH